MEFNSIIFFKTCLLSENMTISVVAICKINCYYTWYIWKIFFSPAPLLRNSSKNFQRFWKISRYKLRGRLSCMEESEIGRHPREFNELRRVEFHRPYTVSNVSLQRRKETGESFKGEKARESAAGRAIFHQPLTISRYFSGDRAWKSRTCMFSKWEWRTRPGFVTESLRCLCLCR